MPCIDQALSQSRKPVCYIQSHKIRLLYKVGAPLYSSPNVVRVIKSKRMRWAGNAARTVEERGCIGSC